LIGLRSNVLTATQGEAVMSHRFKSYEPYKGPISGRINGSIISKGTGPATPYALDRLQERGKFFVDPSEELYMGMVVGEHSRPGDIVVNLQETKKLTNMRASGSDDNVRIAPKINFSLEESMEYIQKDEYLEVTPQTLRIRKVYLDENDRKRYSRELEMA
jgi:GTP-binding protein